MAERLFHAALVLVAMLWLFANSASAMLHPQQGRFMQRDPMGYVDGMGLYEYLRSAPVTGDDPGGTWRIERGGRARGTAIAEVGDRIDGLAQTIQLDSGEIGKWLTFDGPTLLTVEGPRTLERLGAYAKICPGESVRFPNTALIVVGDTSLLGRVLVARWSQKVDDAFRARGFATVFADADAGGFSSGFVRSFVDDSTWGFALFGHGKGSGSQAGNLVLQSDWMGGATDVVTPQDLRAGRLPHFKYGGGISYFCYSNLGGWRGLVSGRGTYYGSRGAISAGAGPRAIGWWGSWDSLVARITGVP